MWLRVHCGTFFDVELPIFTAALFVLNAACQFFNGASFRFKLARALSLRQHEAFALYKTQAAKDESNVAAAAVSANHSRASAVASMSVFHPHQFVDPKNSAANYLAAVARK